MGTNTNYKNYSIESSDGEMTILAPQCCLEWANITVAYKSYFKRSKYRNNPVTRRVYFPSFETETQREYPGDMDFSIFEKYVMENKDRIIQLVHRLCNEGAVNDQPNVQMSLTLYAAALDGATP